MHLANSWTKIIIEWSKHDEKKTNILATFQNGCLYVLLSVLTQALILGKHSRKVTHTLLNMFHNSLILRIIKNVKNLVQSTVKLVLKVTQYIRKHLRTMLHIIRGGSRNLRMGGGGAQHTVFFGPPPASKLAQVPKKLISGGGGGGGDSDTFFSRSAIYGGGGGGVSSCNRDIAGRNQTLFFLRFQKGGGAHVQKGGAFIEKCFKRGGGHEPAVPPPPKSATAYHKVPKLTKFFMHQYFEIMALAMRTLKSDHFAFGVCSLKHDIIRCSDSLTNFSL